MWKRKYNLSMNWLEKAIVDTVYSDYNLFSTKNRKYRKVVCCKPPNTNKRWTMKVDIRKILFVKRNKKEK